MTSANKEIVAKVKCLECPIEKEFNKYDVNRGRQKNWKCRSCAMKSLWAKKGVRTKEEKAAAQKKYYQANKDKLNKYNTKWMHDKRLELINYFGGQCVICEEKDPIVLDFDHIFDDGAEERRLLKRKNIIRHLNISSTDRSRYQLLCKNCNWKKEFFRRKNAKQK
jgi:hypothetical protein